MTDEKRTGGFGSMDPETQRRIASQGGKAVHAAGKGHTFTPEEARTAGKKGGETSSRNREHMSRLGKLGGVARAAKRDARKKRAEGSSPGDDGPKAA